MNKYVQDEEMSLMTDTLRMFEADDRSLEQVHRKTLIPFFWLMKFKRGLFTNPSVNRVQCLWEFLKDEELIKNGIE